MKTIYRILKDIFQQEKKQIQLHFANWPNATDRPKWYGIWSCECTSCRGEFRAV